MTQPSLTIRQYLTGAALALAIAPLLLGLMLYNAETPVRLGLIGNLWYALYQAKACFKYSRKQDMKRFAKTRFHPKKDAHSIIDKMRYPELTTATSRSFLKFSYM